MSDSDAGDTMPWGRRRDEASTTLSEFKLCIASILELIISIISSDRDGGDHVSGCFPNSVQFSSVIITFKISLLRRINYFGLPQDGAGKLSKFMIVAELLNKFVVLFCQSL